jgi:hypothetical protein
LSASRRRMVSWETIFGSIEAHQLAC